MKNPVRAAVLSVFLTLPALAADTTWISTSSTAWNLDANWNPRAPLSGTSLGTIFQDSGTIARSIAFPSGTSLLSLGMQFLPYSGGAGFTLGSPSSVNAFSIRTGGTTNGIVNYQDAAQTFNMSLTLNTSGAGGGSGASQTFNAAGGNLIFSGLYNSTANTLALNGGTITVAGAHDTTIGSPTGRGDIAGNGGLVKNDAGTLTLGGTVANSYVGNTTLNGGTIAAAKANAFGNPGSANQLVLNSGTIETGGFAQKFGKINLLGSATLDLTGGNGALTFGDSSALTWNSGAQLSIVGWMLGDSLRAGTTSTALTASQLHQIVWTEYDWKPWAKIDASGYLSPVPEPSTLALSLLGGAVLAWRLTLRRNRR